MLGDYVNTAQESLIQILILPGIYTNVGHYRYWIDENTKSDKSITTSKVYRVNKHIIPVRTHKKLHVNFITCAWFHGYFRYTPMIIIFTSP